MTEMLNVGSNKTDIAPKQLARADTNCELKKEEIIKTKRAKLMSNEIQPEPHCAAAYRNPLGRGVLGFGLCISREQLPIPLFSYYGIDCKICQLVK